MELYICKYINIGYTYHLTYTQYNVTYIYVSRYEQIYCVMYVNIYMYIYIYVCVMIGQKHGDEGDSETIFINPHWGNTGKPGVTHIAQGHLDIQQQTNEAKQNAL